MNLYALIFLVAGLCVIGWLTGRARAARFGAAAPRRLHSLPGQHGLYVAMWTVLPALIFAVAWSAITPSLAIDSVLSAPQASALPAFGYEREAVLNEIRARAQGAQFGFYPVSEQLAPIYARAAAFYAWIGAGIAILLAFAGGAFAYTRVKADFRARTRVENSVMLVLGTNWSPQVIDPTDPGATLGAVPLFWGTFFIGAVIAMLVAIPFGLMSAIYLTQYARPVVRQWMKPLLEILAGVPTVVYGYFAALTVGPAIRDVAVSLGFTYASSESALAAGLVMGVMIIPFVSSMADDSIAAVPSAMRDGSLAMGATASETIRKVLLPAALPGVVAGVLLAVSRAIGETMIVVMAASGAANITLNPFESATTVTKQIVDLLTGEAEFDSPKTLAAFALGLTLFMITFLLNIVALRVVKKYREAYE